MTDISTPDASVPGRLGVAARFDDGAFSMVLFPRPEVLHHGVVRASVISYLIDAVAGITLDRDPAVWTLTTDMTVRMRAVPAPSEIRAVNAIVRQGRRSATCQVELTTDDGSPVATGAIGFASVPRKEDDPPKIMISPELAAVYMAADARLSRPLREEAGLRSVDPAEGVVEVEITPELRNPAGTLQGAMVSLIAEAAAEDLVATRFESPVIVTDLDLRYLDRTQAGPVRTRSRLLGTGPDAPVEVALVDTSTDRVTTLVYARAVSVP